MCFSCSVEFLLPSSSLHLFPYFTLLYSNNDFQSAMFQSNNPSHFYSTEYFGHCNITMATFEKMSDGSYIIKPIKQKQMVCCTLLVNFNSTEKLLFTLYGTGLSLRAGGRGFSPATKRVAPGYFYWKIEEK